MRDREVAKGRSSRKADGSSDRRTPADGRKAKSVLERGPVQGWKTSDQDEIALRRWRGRTEILDVAANYREQGFLGLFRARSASGAPTRWKLEVSTD